MMSDTRVANNLLLFGKSYIDFDTNKILFEPAHKFLALIKRLR